MTSSSHTTSISPSSIARTGCGPPSVHTASEERGGCSPDLRCSSVTCSGEDHTAVVPSERLITDNEDGWMSYCLARFAEQEMEAWHTFGTRQIVWEVLQVTLLSVSRAAEKREGHLDNNNTALSSSEALIWDQHVSVCRQMETGGTSIAASLHEELLSRREK